MTGLNTGGAASVAAAQAALTLRHAHALSAARVAHLMSLAPSSVHIDTALANFLIRYENREYVADEVMPIVAVNKRSDKIFEIPVETMQTVSDVQIAGSRARPNELAYSVNSSHTYSVSDYGLIDFVGADEETNADAPLQPRLLSADVLMNALLLAREVRVAAVAFGSSNYGSNHSALSGGNKWDAATSAPVQNILDAIEACFIRPNTLTLGGQVWKTLRNNPDVKSFVLSRPSTKQGATPMFMDLESFAAAFELDKVVVGRAKINNAREGATVVSSYVWGKSAALTRTEPQPNPRSTKTFGYTYRYQSRAIQNQVIPELIAGVRGGVYVKLTHSDDEKTVAAGNAGYLYETVIS